METEVVTIVRISDPSLLGTSNSLCISEILFLILPDYGLIVQAGGWYRHVGLSCHLWGHLVETNGCFIVATEPRFVENDTMDFSLNSITDKPECIWDPMSDQDTGYSSLSGNELGESGRELNTHNTSCWIDIKVHFEMCTCETDMSSFLQW